MQESYHEPLRAGNFIIENERVNSINISLQFPGRNVRRVLQPPKQICPARTFYILIRTNVLDGFSLAGNGLGAAVAIRLVGTGGKTQPLAP